LKARNLDHCNVADPTNLIVVRHSEGPPQRGDLMGRLKNTGFNAKVQLNLWLGFVTKQHNDDDRLTAFDPGQPG